MMNTEVLSFNIEVPDETVKEIIQKKIDGKTKPLGSLGMLEEIAMKVAAIQNTAKPVLTEPHIFVFAGDHGVARAGVSAYPQDVTWQMVMNFTNGGAAINVFCRQHQIKLYVVDAGVNYEFPKDIDGLLHEKINYGTANFIEQAAMTHDEAATCIIRGAGLVKKVKSTGCNVIGFGEMGIGNTSSASLLTSMLCKVPVERCVGRGTGLDDEGVQRKTELLKFAIDKHGAIQSPIGILSTFGGFEIAQMTGAMLQAAQEKMIILVDGFIATAAFLVAYKMYPEILHYAIFCHQSGERGHQFALSHLNATPVLNLYMRLGEGTGAAVAYPLIVSAVNFLNEMASFESAGVSNKA